MKTTNLLLTAIGSMFLTQSAYCFVQPNQSIIAPLTAQSTYGWSGWSTESTDSLERYAGEYEIGPGEQLKISVSDGKLFLLPPGETNKAELKWVRESEFAVVGEPAQVFFRADHSGQVTEVEVRFGNGASTKARKR